MGNELSELIKDEFDNFQREASCSNCDAFVEFVYRIKTCGHFFCKTCIDVNEKQCPVCKEPFDLKEVDRHKLSELLTKMKELRFIVSNMLLSSPPTLLKSDTAASETLHKDISCSNTTAVVKLKRSSMITSKSSEGKTKSGESIKSAHSNEFKYMNDHYRINFNSGIDIRRNAKGETPLHHACSKKNFSLAFKLIEDGADINAKDYAGWAPLHEAVDSGSDTIVKILIDNGALLDVPGDTYVTPLHKAIINKSWFIAKLLIENGADLEVIDYYGNKPLECTLDENMADELKQSRPSEIKKATRQIFVSKKVLAYCHSIDEEYQNKLMKAKNNLIGFKKYFSINDQTLTHLFVKPTHRISCKILLAIAAGLFIFPQNCIDNILEGKYYLPLSEEIQIVSDTKANRAIKKSILNRLLGKPKLFDGINFFIEGHKKDMTYAHLTISKDFLKVLIEAGGGKVLQRAPAPRTVEDLKSHPYHADSAEMRVCAHVILFDDKSPPTLQYNMPELKHKSSRWLLECVHTFDLDAADKKYHIDLL